MSVTTGSVCTIAVGTRCQYPSPNNYTARCQCYTASAGDKRWWCDDHYSMAWDGCPAEYPGNGTCPNIGDVTCNYVDPDGKLKACNCLGGIATCYPWGQ